jgi:hypothetical protein
MKLIALALFIVLSTLSSGQNSNNIDFFERNNCDCIQLTKAKLDSLNNADDGEKTAFFSNGQLKQKETKRQWKACIICYHQTGIKCREMCLNFKTHIQKTIIYDATGKKYMVCKGSMK